MKKIIILLLSFIILVAGIFSVSSCEFIGSQDGGDKDEATYQLNSGAFNSTIAYGETPDVSTLFISKTDSSGITNIPVDPAMVTCDTSSIGAKTLTVTYMGNTFNLTVYVKYRVIFMFNGEVVDTQYVASAFDIVNPKVTVPESHTFGGFDIPEALTDNVIIDAQSSYVLPEVSDVTAEYSSSLSEIKLPSNDAGAWQFDIDGATKVGETGSVTEYAVSFITNDGITAGTDKINVTVVPKKVNFTNVVTSFTYNGRYHYPTYQTDVPGVKTDIIFDTGNGNYSSVGSYGFTILVVDEVNYEGEYTGTFVINPANVTVTIESYSIFAYQDVPEIEYSIIGFNGDVQVLALEIETPEIKNENATYTLTATTSNKNVNLTVVEGTLTVSYAPPAIEEVGAPVLNKSYATYEDLLSSLEFEYNNFGTWSWKTPDATVGDVGKNKHIAVFNHTVNGYAPLEYEYELEVKPKALNITIKGNTEFTYDQRYHSVEYTVTDSEGKDYSHLAVEGNEQYVNAGRYTVSLSIANPNYTAFAQATITIHKANPSVNFNATLEAVWSPTLKLGDVELPMGYRWIDSDAKISSAGIVSHRAIYVPQDTDNYNSVDGVFKINVAKADASINNVNNSYSFIYNGSAHTLDAVTGSHSDSALEFSYVLNGASVQSMTNVGEYTVTVTLPESDNYKAATATTIVKIAKADVSVAGIAMNQTAVFGDLLSTLDIPESELGEWSFKNADASATVGDAGVNYFTLVFTPGTENYNSCEVTITVTVSKCAVEAPSISESKLSQSYTGEKLTSGLTSGKGYTVTDNGGTNIGAYTVTLALVSDNYVWSDGTSADKNLTYNITRAENTWTAAPSITSSWVYGSSGDEGSATAKYGDVIITYAPKGSTNFTDALPTAAGEYTARFTAEHPNAKTITLDIDFTITKKSVALPVYTTVFTYTGNPIKANIGANADYTKIEDPTHTDVGSYAAYVEIDSANCIWADGNTGARRAFSYTIEKATIVISGFTVADIVYGATPAPAASASFSANVIFLYSNSENGTYAETVPTNAGTYYVKAKAEGNDNLNGAETDPISFTISKAPVTISGYESSYEFYYNGSAYTFSGITASNGGALNYAVTKNGASVSEIKTAGAYSVTITLKNTDNHSAEPVTVTVTVKQAVNSDTVDTAQEATYGDLLSTLALPSSATGTWSWKNAIASTTVGNAGTNTFKAVFTPNDTVNYESREVTVTVTVGKKTVELPNVDAKTYDGTHFYSGLTTDENSLYVITEDLGGTEKGRYSVTLKLKDKNNYEWETTFAESVTIYYDILEAANTWKTQPSINSTWEYGDAGDEGTAEATFGGVIIKYKPKDAADSEYTETLPTLPGSYTAYFASVDTNYNILEKTIDFTITKKKIDVPSITKNEFTYSGSNITLGVPQSTYYTITDNGGTDVNSYSATVTLNSSYYVWSDKDENLTKTFTYSIVKADVTLSGLAVNGWTYGTAANTPTVEKNFTVDVDFLYSTSADGEFTKTVPTDAGTYFVKASFGGNKNLNPKETAAISFEITKASATINGASTETYTKAYDGSAYVFEGITASSGSVDLTSSIKYSLTSIKNAGTYSVLISLDSKNYEAEPVTVTLEITKAQNNDTIPTYSATYGDLLSSLALPSTTTGTWSWENAAATVGNAGTQNHKLVFTPTDSANYAQREVTVAVSVAKKVIATPTLTNNSFAYDSKAHNAGLAADTRYSFTDAGATNVGTYTVTLTLTDSSNYAWDAATNASATTAVTYYITEGTNALSSITMNGWTYGQTGTAGSAKATYGSVNVAYKLASAPDTAYGASLPTAAGDYIARFTTTDANCPIVTEYRTFTIAKATVTTPTVAAATTKYTGSKITSGITAGTLYNVYDNGGINVGNYTARVELKDKDNYKWSTTGESADINLGYAIEKANASITALTITGWTYGMASSAPSATANIPCTIVYRYFDANGNDLGAIAPTGAGSYTVKAIVEGTSNYNGTEKSQAFTIDRAAPVIVGTPYFTAGKHYQNELIFSTVGFTAYNENNSAMNVSGTYSYGQVIFAEGEGNSTVTLTLTPSDSVNYKPVTVTYNLTLVTVAKLNNSTPYGTIEDAVAAANAANGGTVWVLPNDTNLGTIYIKSDVTINNGVTLLLPYGSRDSYKRNSSGEATLSGNSAIANESKCTTLVIISAGVKITNYGNIEIAGEISGGAGESQYAGHTAGVHARLLLSDNASIVSDNGSTIKCYGFICNATVNTEGARITAKNGAKIYQPFVLEDFRGGSYMAGVNNAMESGTPASPFNRFVMMNVSVPLTIEYGGILKGWANLYAGSRQNHTEVNMIGITDDYVIQLTHSNGYVDSKYVPEENKCYLDIFGGAQTNSMSLKVTVSVFSKTIHTTSCYFPIAHYYQITLNKTEDQTTASYYMNQDFKLLTGSSLTVEEGAILEATKLIVYDEFTDTFDPDVNTADRIAQVLYPEKGAAIFTVNGTFICDQFGGKIYSDSVGATVKITAPGITGYEVIAKDGNNHDSTKVTCTEITLDAELVGASNIAATADATYVFNGEEWILYVASISFDTNGGNNLSDLALGGEVYPALPTPIKEGFKFAGWYYGDILVKEGDAFAAEGEHELKASWIPLIAIGLDEDGDGTVDQTVYFENGANAVYPALPTPTSIGYVFLGWYYGDTLVKEGDAIATAEAHTLTARWTPLTGVGLDNDGDGIADETVYVDTTVNAPVYPALPTPTSIGYVFLGWYYGETLVSANDPVVATGDHVLAAKWQKLISVELNTDGGEISEAIVYTIVKDGVLVYPELPTPTKAGYKFIGWSYGDVSVKEGDEVLNPEEHTLLANWQKVSYKITTSTSNATITGAPSSAYQGDTITITVSFSKWTEQTLTVANPSTGETVATTKSGDTYSFTMPAFDVKITASSKDPSCVTPETLITLADGTQKEIQYVTYEDKILVWNFYTGTYDIASASIIMNHGYDTVDVLTLYFEDGTSINTINGHGFFSVESNSFVIVNKENVTDFVGHSFIKLDGNGYASTKLVDYSVNTKYTEIWSILTAEHYNCILENMWTVTEAEIPNSPNYLMPYKIGDGMKYDEASMQADIEKYGLYTYEDFKNYCSYEAFVALGLENFKVSVAKGYITWDEIIFLLSIHAN